MKNTPEYIHQLMTEKLAGVISAMDEHYLDELISEIAAVREKWEEVQSAFTREDLENDLQHLKEKKWPDSRELLGMGRGRLIPLFRKIPAAAASIAAVLIIGWAVYQWAGIAGKEEKLVFEVPSQKHISLKLANGSSIDLSREQGSIAAGTALLNNHQKALSYMLTGASETGINTLTVPAGLDYKLTLSDSTEIWLNSTTRIEFPFVFEGGTREIRIDGEAYLKVSRDIQKPFVVHLPQSTVQVLGTEFNVNTYDEGTEKVALVKGLVSVRVAADEINVQPGYQATYTQARGWSRETFEEDKVLSWRHGLFYFYDSSLQEICQVLPRWFGISVVIDDPEIKNKHFAGMVDRNQPVEEFLDNLKAITAIDYYLEPGAQVVHFRNAE